jgi:hypothetical protein
MLRTSSQKAAVKPPKISVSPSKSVASPPTAGDYLPAAVQKAIVANGLKHPLTVYPVAVSLSCGFVGWLFSLPMLYLITLAGLLLGGGWAAFQIFFLSKKNKNRYLEQLSQKQKQYERYLRDILKNGLIECSAIKGLENFARQGNAQFGSIQEKLRNIRELLQIKLKSGEMTYGRFLGAAEQVSLSVLDNLKTAVTTMKSMESIRTDYIQQRLAALSHQQNLNREEKKEAKALQTRLKLWQDQQKIVARLLANNEEAMTEMEQISAAVANWQTDGRFASSDFESAIARLHELARQAHEYNK